MVGRAVHLLICAEVLKSQTVPGLGSQLPQLLNRSMSLNPYKFQYQVMRTPGRNWMLGQPGPLPYIRCVLRTTACCSICLSMHGAHYMSKHLGRFGSVAAARRFF
jgi:hypothetical protein